MKKILCGILTVWLLPGIDAQQKPHYTQYILNQYIVNPAITGIENYVDVKLSHRHQWVGIQDAPVTTYFTIQGAIGKKDYRESATSYSIPGQNPRGKSYWEQYATPGPHHGVGMQVVNDRTGPLNRFAAYATYAYHLGLNSTTTLAAGFGVGFTNLSLNTSKLDFGPIAMDPAVASSGILNRLKPDINAGLYLYTGNYFVGLSAQQVIPQRIDYSDNAVKTTEGKFIPHLFGTAGYRFLLGEDLNFTPSLMVKYVDPLPVQFELNAKLQYRDLVWLGGSYRQDDGFAGMVGLNVANTFNVGYAYDYTTSTLNNYTKGTHEIIIGFLIGNRYGDTCPRNVW
jgi:type IX secretion system PorP/SprF family membrane protein